MTCTCLPLNSRLMAHLLKVDEGSVHEQGCVENAVATARAAVRAQTAAELETEWYNGNLDGPAYYRLCKRLGLEANPTANRFVR